MCTSSYKNTSTCNGGYVCVHTYACACVCTCIYSKLNDTCKLYVKQKLVNLLYYLCANILPTKYMMSLFHHQWRIGPTKSAHTLYSET